ncbi:MAG: hypothetical protein GY703_17585 [Gammaproteobacteria bacterium]|nr:hypothetical protein [Gammaproteobacteria bacterium]
MSKGDWKDDPDIIGYKWASTGGNGLSRRRGCFRLSGFAGSVSGRLFENMDSDSIIGRGDTETGCWYVLRHGPRLLFTSSPGYRRIVLNQACPETISETSLSPDGETLACVEDGQAVGFWSTQTGRKLFTASLDMGATDDIFGQPEIDTLSWSAGSNLIAVQPAFPVAGLSIVDFAGRQIVGEIG